MSLTINSEDKSISGSMRSLAERLCDIDHQSGIGLLSAYRAELGQMVHRRYDKQRQEEYGAAFRAEVPLSLNMTIGGWQLNLRGRADGLIAIDENSFILEEVKSLALGAGQLDLLTKATLAPFIWQLELYALALLGAAAPRSLTCRLVLVSLQDNAVREVEIEHDGAAFMAELARAIGRLGAASETQAAVAARRAALAPKLLFPYAEIRPPQQMLMEEIALAIKSGRPILATAPTGTGKTISTIFPALTAALRQNLRLWFTTAKRTQSEMARRSFNEIVAASHLEGELHALVMAKKEQLCPTGHLLCHHLVCPFLAAFKERLLASKIITRLLKSATTIDSAVIKEEAIKDNLCPYEVALKLCHEVDLVIGDYNYLYDKRPYRAASRQEGEAPPIAIIDEAHNLFDRVRESYSPSVALEDIASAQKTIEHYLMPKKEAAQLALDLEEVKSYSDPELGAALMAFLEKLAELINHYIALGPSEENPEIGQSWRLVAGATEWSELAEEAAALLVRYALFRKMARLVGPSDIVQELLDNILQICDLLLAGEAELIPYVSLAETKGKLGILCLSPALYLTAIHKRFLTTIAVSATLDPLDYFADILGFAPLNPLLVDLPSPFPPEERLVVIEKSIETRYSQRAASYRPIAERIAAIIKEKPGNYMAFFPSFAFLEAVAKELAPIIDPAVTLFKQKHTMSDADREACLVTMRQKSGILLLAVMGGIFAEGIDLAGEALIGAIIVGPALPQVGFERSLMCRYFEETREAGFAYGMLFPGMQKVVQAAGRVIRTADDRGIIVLLDRRFGQHPYCDALPRYWYDEHAGELITGDLLGTIRHFWAHPGQKPLIMQPEEAAEEKFWDEY